MSDPQQQEMIEKFAAENRRLVNEIDRLRFELKAYKAKFGQLQPKVKK